MGLPERCGFGACVGILLTACVAKAYCRTTTCDVDNAEASCKWDAHGCATIGHPLFWPDKCGWFGVQKDGSPKLGIPYETLHADVAGAFDKWGKADCGGGAVPSFSMQDTDQLYGPVECSDREFNKDAANASVWMFRDSSWPYVGGANTIALTTLSVEISTGKILDADVEINSFLTDITTSDVEVGSDLDSIVTHEAGHFLGLAHSADSQATMFKNYTASSLSIRSLAPDDEAGICAVYPPGDTPACGPPEPIYGFSKYCGGKNPSTLPVSSGSNGKGCAVAPGESSSGAAAATVLALVVAAGAFRRRRGRANGSATAVPGRIEPMRDPVERTA